MSMVAAPVPSGIRLQRQKRAAEAQSAALQRMRARIEPLLIFLVTAGIFFALGDRTTVHLHVIYPGALTRLGHAYIAWWNHPPRFRAIGFTYPPLQTVVLLPFALLRPLATSLVALPLFSALCAGALVAILNRTLSVLGLAWWLRGPLLLVFACNPLFIDYASNGMATVLVMALLAAGLLNFTSWYVTGADSVRSLGFCGSWLAIAFLARYETALWLVVIAVAVATVRLRRRATLVEVLALEAILLAPVVYTFLIWSGVSSLVGGGGFLSWITRSGAEHLGGLNFGGRVGFGHRAAGILDVIWRISPLLLIIPAALVLVGLLARRPILLSVAAMVLVGAAAAVVRMWLRPNAELLQPDYEMLALVPMLVASGWLIAQFPGRGAPVGLQSGRIVCTLLVLAGLGGSAVTAYDLMKNDGDSYDRAFTYALSSHLKRATRTANGGGPLSTPRLYADVKSVSTFLQAVEVPIKTVLIDELAFPGVVLDADSTVPYRTQAENGMAFFNRLLDHPRSHAKIEYLVVANPKVAIPGYPTDVVSQRYPNAYAGGLAHSQVIYRNPIVAVVRLLPLKQTKQGLLPTNPAKLLQLYQNLPSLSRHKVVG